MHKASKRNHPESIALLELVHMCAESGVIFFFSRF